MDDSGLILREEWTSCFNKPLSEDLIAIATISQPQNQSTSEQAQEAATPTTMRVLPRMAYALPAATNSAQSEACDIDIYFAVNQSNINDKFMNNAEQIEKLGDALKNKDIKEIKITGYASPEGPYNFNKTLAAHRAEAVKKHITTNNSAANITVNSYPANWEEVKAMLGKTYIENWQGIVAIIDDTTISAADKNNAIRKKYPVEYEFMLNTWYPKMRVTDIAIEYNERKMSVNEVKSTLKSNPSQLSLEDIYMVALTYEKGSKEWDEIILIAVDNYPQSPEARINAANVAMANGDYAAAEQYLQGVPANIPEAMNSRGILAMAQGDYTKALDLFQQALNAGVTEAAYNITLVRELMNAEQ
jgi:outer membrane protein OmpA-like peptidoglycan-associated protein